VVVPRSFCLSVSIGGGQRIGLVGSLSDCVDEDPKIPIPPLIDPGHRLDLKVEPTFAIVLQNADVDTGIFMLFDELPTLYEFVREKVFPPLEKLVPNP